MLSCGSSVSFSSTSDTTSTTTSSSNNSSVIMTIPEVVPVVRVILAAAVTTVLVTVPVLVVIAVLLVVVVVVLLVVVGAWQKLPLDFQISSRKYVTESLFSGGYCLHCCCGTVGIYVCGRFLIFKFCDRFL